ncbi:MAG: response regulator [Lachnospiraceae bacterium]
MIAVALFLLLKGDGSREQKLMQYIGSLAIPISYCYFMFSYCYEKTPVRFLKFVKIVDIFILGLEYGSGYWLFMLCGTDIPYVLSMYALVRVCINKPDCAAERQYKLILGLSFLPVVVLYLYVVKLSFVYDPTPFVLGIVLAGVVILVWSRKVYDFSSLASGILLDSMSDGVIAIDVHERIVSYNPAATGIFGDLNSRAVGKHIEELEGFPLDMLHEEGKVEFCRNDRFYQGHAEQILDKYGEKKGYVILILDMTETRNYIEEITCVREQAEQANIAKSAFLANMSHEIRTPMNAIVGLSDIIMEESKGRKVYEYVCDIKASAHNLLALINDILDLSKVEAGKMELIPTEYHVRSLVKEVLNMMDIVASQHGLMVESEYDMSIPCGYFGDESRIKQILVNLLNNALKFTKKGHVKITVSGRPGETQDTERLLFQVQDTGCGIREEDLEKIFENFKQIDSKRNRSAEGTGLGLSITRHLAEMMQGTVSVESVYGEGSTFTVEILQKIADARPLSEVPETGAKKEEPLEPFTVKDYKVLVVDDNSISLATIEQALKEKYEVAPNLGVRALQYPKKNRPDLILLDVKMASKDGVETLREIREMEDCQKIPVIMLTSQNDKHTVLESFMLGADNYILKPFNVEDLHERIETVLRKGR